MSKRGHLGQKVREHLFEFRTSHGQKGITPKTTNLPYRIASPLEILRSFLWFTTEGGHGGRDSLPKLVLRIDRFGGVGNRSDGGDSRLPPFADAW